MIQYYNKKIKILYITKYSEIIGGGQKSLLYLLKYLPKEKFEPIIALPSLKGNLVEEINKVGLKTVKLKLKSKLLFIDYILNLLNIIKNYNVKIIHCDDIYIGVYTGLVKLFYKINLIFHARVGNSGRWWDILIYLLSDKIICVSQSTSERFKLGKKIYDKTKVIYNGVDFEEIKNLTSQEVIKNKYNIPPNDFIIGFSGQIIEKKGVDILIRSFKIVKEKIKSVKLVFVGYCPQKGKYNKLIKLLSLEKDILFAGFCVNSLEVMNTFDILVLPTKFKEGLSRSIIEAMALGKPVISTSLASNNEIIIDGVNGFLIPIDNISLLVEKICLLAKNKDILYKMGQEAYKIAKEKFDIKQIIKQVEDIYYSVLSD